MTAWQSYESCAARDVPWDKERERRVLGRALHAFRRRARRHRALQLSAALAAILIVSRALPRAASDGNGAENTSAVPAAQLEASRAPGTAISQPNGAAPRVKRSPSSGFAGTGGHGGGSSMGGGGSAGTG